QDTRGITWLLIGHDLAVMRHMADDLIVMRAGEVVERGPAADVLAHPSHPYARELLAAAPNVGRALDRRASGARSLGLMEPPPAVQDRPPR
ncbi:MAG: ABC transporter ATP-binding protein, partial [Spartobacteria bacterium]|nr:ABC transporter ATP-binding protein [Spartobacteria bacterium]